MSPEKEAFFYVLKYVGFSIAISSAVLFFIFTFGAANTVIFMIVALLCWMSKMMYDIKVEEIKRKRNLEKL